VGTCHSAGDFGGKFGMFREIFFKLAWMKPMTLYNQAIVLSMLGRYYLVADDWKEFIHYFKD